MEAIERGRRSAPVPWPNRGRRVDWTRADRERLQALKLWRTSEAQRLGLDPGIVWPLDHLKRIALHPGVGAREADCAHPAWVRDWQWGELGASLDAFRRQEMGGA